MRHAVAVKHPTQAARRQNVARRAKQCIVGYRVRTELLHRQLDLAVVDVADQQLGTGGVQLFGQGKTDVAQALDGDAQAFEIIAAQPGHRRGANAGKHAHRRVRGGVAGRRGAGDVLGLLGDAIHVRHRGATVDGGDVAPVELIDTTSEGFKERSAIGHMDGANNHRHAAALGQPGQRRLIAHALGKAHGILDRRFVAGIGKVSTATQGRPETAVMNGNDRLQPGGRVDAQMQRFKASALHESEHRRAPESLLVDASIGLRPKIAEAHRNKRGRQTSFRK
ncbi:hypothetical protein D3C76_1012110 [compost metagenome]